MLRIVPFGLRLLERTGGPFSPPLSIVWMLGMVWPDVVGAADDAPGWACDSLVGDVGDLACVWVWVESWRSSLFATLASGSASGGGTGLDS